MTCSCGSTLFAVQVTAMLGVNGGQVQPVGGRLVCGSCSQPLDGFQVVATQATNFAGLTVATERWPSEGDGHP